METRTRKTIFWTLFAIFFTATPLVIFYCLGWRFNWDNNKPIQTGVFYFKTSPKGAQIFANGNPKGKTDIVFGSLLIEDLIPGKYKIEIKKEGFLAWEKTLEIKKGEAVEAKDIVLVPENPAFQKISENANNFFLSFDSKKIIIQEADPKTPGDWELKLLEKETGIKSLLLRKKDLSTRENMEITGLDFSYDSKTVLLKIAAKENERWYLLDLDDSQKKPIRLYSIEGAENISFHPKNYQKVFFLKNNFLYEEDLLTQNAKKISMENIISFALSEKDIYYLSESGYLYKNDFSLANEEKMNESPIQIVPETQHSLKIDDKLIFLKRDNVLLIFNELENSFKEISKLVETFEVSPDFKKVFVSDGYDLRIIFLEKNTSQPIKEIGDTTYLGKSLTGIKNFFWYTNNYLIFLDNQDIKISEIDDRDNINVSILNTTKKENTKLFWDEKTKSIYFISSGILYFSESLIP